MARKSRGTSTYSIDMVLKDAEGNEYDVSLAVKAYCYNDPGRCYGPVESCYPSESEVDIESVLVEDAYGADPDFLLSLIDDAADETIAEKVFAEFCDGGEEEY